ncbi:MAG: Gfo/Idh/MocA family protein, partial [Planctomycetota bacterium]
KGGKFYPNGSDKGEDLGDVEYHLEPGGVFQNFIDCVRSRDASKLQAPIQEAHPSAALCHLANIAYRLGEQVPGTTMPDVLERHEQVGSSWAHIKQSLKDAIGLDVEKSTYQLGPMIKFDPAKEKFVDNAEANALVTRDYRKPFEVTQEV